MPTKTYKCINFAVCDKALSKELITIDDTLDYTCPSGEAECQKKYLQPAKSAKAGGGGLPKPVLIGVAGLVIVAGLGYFLWPSGPEPELADSMLTDFFPRLK